MTPARFKALYDGLTSAAQKVYNAVPIAGPWTILQIQNEIARCGSNSDRKLVAGCLASLVESRLIVEPRKGEFLRAEVRERPEATTSFVREASPEPLPAPTLAQRVNSIAEGLRALADEIAIVGLEIEDELASSSADAQKLKQLHQLLKSLS